MSRLRTAAVLMLVATGFAAMNVPAEGSPPERGARPSAAAAADPVAAARDHLLRHRDKYGLSEADVKQLAVSSVVPTASTGLTSVYLQQQVNSIDVFNAIVNVAVREDGSVFRVASSAVPYAAQRANDASPGISDLKAVKLAAEDLGLTPTESFQSNDEPSGPDQARLLARGGISLDRISAHLVYQQAGSKKLRLSWEFVINQLDGEHWWQTRIDAETGAALDKNDWVAHEDYRVYDSPTEAPSFGGRTLETNPADANASPFGWHDTNGVAGAESTLTIGNNANAYVDANDDDLPDAGSQPSGGAGLSFDFPLDLTQPPTAYRPAAVTNLFYWNNLIHDVMYSYGFDEASGNFQENAYGNGGAGSDSVNAEAQDGGGTNNANFATPPDGGNPRMQMYVWDLTTPARDGDLDNGIIVHEYGHGISNRLTGGPATTSCLGNAEQGGEGWSDWFGLMMTMPSGTEPATGRGIGTYALGQPTTGPGIRTQKYSTDPAINTYTYDTIKTAVVPHGVGSVWAQMLWQMTWALIDKHGFDPDLIGGTGGNNLALQLVMDGLKLQPCSPGFVDARDAILDADQAANGGDNACEIWGAFAEAGLGFSASQGSSSSVVDGTQAFDQPPACQGLVMTRTDSPDPVQVGEDIGYGFRVENTSGGSLSGVSVTSDLGDNSTYVPGSANCSGTYNGTTHRVTFPIGGLTTGQVRNCSFQATADGPGGTTLFEDDFEPDLSAWTATHGAGTLDWSLTTTTPNSPTHAAFATDPNVVSDQYLAMDAPVAITAGDQLSFFHKYDLEAGFDGGVVEVSTNGGTTWGDIGAGNWVENGYNRVISTSWGSPIGGRAAFSGSQPTYVESVADLGHLAGENVLIRFRMGSDTSIAALGWWVDDVHIGDREVVVNDATVDSSTVGPFSETVTTEVIAATGPPGAPTVDDARAISRTSARVFITDGAPGGSAIDGYMAHCTSNDGGTTRTRATGSEPVTVRNMTPGATYHCRARVSNAAGFGPFSAFSPFFLQAVPPLRPTNVTGVAVSSTSADVSFTPGAERGTPTTGYQARCVSPNGGTTRVRTQLANPVEVLNLTTGRNYRCEVRAISAAGNSPYSVFSPLFPM